MLIIWQEEKPMRSKSFDEYKKEALSNPSVASAYALLEPQYQVIREMIRYRLEHRISQNELAERTGISKSNISRFESGKHSPTLSMIYRIADGLGKKINFTMKEN